MKNGTTLKEWGGIFYPNSYPEEKLRHTYWFGNKQRFGATGLVGWACGSYEGVSKKTLDEAALFGSNIHEEIESYLTFGGEADTDALKYFKKIQDEHQLRFIASEFIVGNKFFASPIDMVADTPECEDDEVILIDFKVTSQRLEEKVSLQLSLYADWFEKQTGLKVKGIYHMWFKKEKDKATDTAKVVDCEFNEVNRQPRKVLTKLIREYLKCIDRVEVGECEGKIISCIQAHPSETYIYNASPISLLPLSRRLDKAYQKYLLASQELEQLKQEFMEKMTEHEHVHTYRKGNMVVSFVPGKESSKFNSAAWKKDHPEEVEKYTTISKSKSYITIKYGAD